MAPPRRYNLNNSSRPSGSSNNAGGATTSSPAPASGNAKTASSNTASQNAGGPAPGVLLGLSGGWLVTRMIFLGGVLLRLEIIAIIIAAGFVYPKGGKVQKRFATAIIAVALLNIFAPGLNPWIKGLRDSQLNPPPTEQSAGQQEQVVLAPVEEIPSTERVVVAGRKITLTGDGTYSIPAGKKSLCFENLGMKDGSSMKSQYLTINGLEYSALGTKCHSLPDDLNGKISVELFNGKSRDRVKKIYDYWRSQPGGQAEWPIIRIGE